MLPGLIAFTSLHRMTPSLRLSLNSPGKGPPVTFCSDMNHVEVIGVVVVVGGVGGGSRQVRQRALVPTIVLNKKGDAIALQNPLPGEIKPRILVRGSFSGNATNGEGGGRGGWGGGG